MRAVGISGSLRAQSTNKVLLQALALLTPPDLEIVIFEELVQIPAFNPDLETTGESGVVLRFRTALRESDMVVFASPHPLQNA